MFRDQVLDQKNYFAAFHHGLNLGNLKKAADENYHFDIISNRSNSGGLLVADAILLSALVTI